MLDIEIIKKTVKDYLWEPYKKYIISIELYGSCTLDFLTNQRDIDLILVCKDFNTAKTLRKVFGLKSFKKFRQDFNFCIHIAHKTYFSESKLMFAYEWESKFRKILFSKSINGVEEVRNIRDILNYKDVYLKSITDYINTILISSNKIFVKSWYWIYTGICIINNNSYNFTKEQQEKIQILHDIDIINNKYIEAIAECCNFLNIDRKNILKEWSNYVNK